MIDAVWRGEALGTLLWALQLEELPPYDEPFAPQEVASVPLEPADLRDREGIELERESARLWHWRARTTAVQADGSIELPERFASFDQLTPEERAEAHSIALERHHALSWLCGEGATWEDVPLDT